MRCNRLGLSCLVVCVWLAAAKQTGFTAGFYTVSSTSLGVEVRLQVPRTAYERGSLVMAHVWVRNVSQKAVYLIPGCRSDQSPQAQVLTISGRVTYPTNLPGEDGSCPRKFIFLRPNGQVYTPQYIVLQSAYIRGEANLSVHGRTRSVLTKSIHVRLMPGSKPMFTLTTSPQLSATFMPGGNVVGPLIYRESGYCKSSQEVVSWSNEWRQAQQPVLIPDSPSACGTITEWHVQAGWINQPVASLNYVVKT